MPEDDRIFDKLAVVERKIDALTSDVKTINGTQQAHTAWIATHNEITTSQVLRLETLALASAVQHDYQERQKGGWATAKPLVIVLWTLSLALAGALGAYIGHIVT